MSWRQFDLETLPRWGTRIRLVLDTDKTGMFAGTEARFLCVCENIRDGAHVALEGPWVIGWRSNGIPLTYLPTAWEWWSE